MTLKDLVSEICSREGKLTEVRVGDVREILRILIDLEAEGAQVSKLIEKLASKKK